MRLSSTFVREIAGKVPLLQPGEVSTGEGDESRTAGEPRERAPVVHPVVVTAPVLPEPASPPEAREAVETAVASAGFNEAIVKRFGRPVLLVRNDTFEVPASDTWKAILFPYKSRLDAAIPSVGRVELVSSVPPYIGTAWMITKEIAVTPPRRPGVRSATGKRLGHPPEPDRARIPGEG
jgi:hypothetical protein